MSPLSPGLSPCPLRFYNIEMEKSPEIREIGTFFLILSPLSPILKKLIGKRKNKNKIVFLEIGDNGDKLPRKPLESPYLRDFYVSPLLSPNPSRGQIRGQRGQMGNHSKILGKPVNTGFLALFLLIPQGTDENSGDTFQSFPFVPVVPVSPKA